MDSAIHLINKSCNSFCYPLFGIIPRQGLFLSPQNTFHWRAGSWSSESVMNKVFIWLWNLDNWFWAKILPSGFVIQDFSIWRSLICECWCFSKPFIALSPQHTHVVPQQASVWVQDKRLSLLSTAIYMILHEVAKLLLF